MRFQRDGWSVESALAKGRPLPDWYEDEPELLPGEHFYIRAFWDLSSERQIGMGLGPIPYFARRRYALEAGLDWSMIRPFVEIMGRLDAVYLEWTSEQQKKTRG